MTEKKKTLSLVEQAAALLGEKVSTGGGATGATKGPEPVAAAGGDSHKNRPQDKKQGDPMVKPQNPAGTEVQDTNTENNTAPTGDNSEKNRGSVAMHSVKEAVDAMFAGHDVSEEFKTKAATIFEAAVGVRVAQEKTKLEEDTKAQIAEAVEQVEADLTTKLDEYLTYATEQWMQENALAIENGIRADISESFMKGLHQLFTEHYIDVPEDKIDAVTEMASRIEELEGTLNIAVNENIELKKKVNASDRTKVVEAVTTGLVETQKAKLSSLFDNVEFTTPEEFQKKLETIKEGYLQQGTPAKKDQSIKNLLEQVDEGTPQGEKTTDPIVEPQVRTYVDAISRTLGAR